MGCLLQQIPADGDKLTPPEHRKLLSSEVLLLLISELNLKAGPVAFLMMFPVVVIAREQPIESRWNYR